MSPQVRMIHLMIESIINCLYVNCIISELYYYYYETATKRS